ncbi:MAG TPA: hypothetical protein VHW91_02855 [Candidatus Dormibacteraeota bacterium]|nr:hypothetical protein [Candidatus Dormibacteraeota bacterium]
MQPLQDRDGHRDDENPPPQVHDRNHHGDASQAPIPQQHVSKAGPGLTEDRSRLPGHPRFGNANDPDDGGEEQRGRGQHCRPRAGPPRERAGERWAGTLGEGVGNTVERAAPVPQSLGHDQGDQRTRATVAERERQRANRDDRQQDRGRQSARRIEAGDQRQGQCPYEVIGDDQADPSMAVEQGAGNRADHDSRHDSEEDGEARERGRMKSLQHKEDQRQLHHLIRGAG